MNEHIYLYGITWATSSLSGPTRGLDPRYPVALIFFGQLAALASLVGLDNFDPSKLQEGTTDVKWLAEVAVRHNEILSDLARRWPVLPLRLGTLFESRASLLAKMAQYEDWAADFLRRLGDRREWAVKVYLDEARAKEGLLPVSSSAPHEVEHGILSETAAGKGTHYLDAQRQRGQRRREIQAAVRRELSLVESRLQEFADSWRQLLPLPSALADRREKMIWNGAFLLSEARRPPFQAACEDLQRDLEPKGLILARSGPWPPYHFCPLPPPERENHDAVSTGYQPQ